MWDYSFEFPILMIMGIILAFYLSRPILSLRRNRLFLLMILTETLTIIFDLAATVVDNDYTSYGITLIKILNSLYFTAFFVRAYIMYLFVACVLKDPLFQSAVLKQFIRLPLYFGILATLLSLIFSYPLSSYFIFYIDESGFHAGYMYNLLYICGLYYILLSFGSSYLYRNTLWRRREKYSMFLYNLILLAALVIRLTMPKYLIMDSFVFMAILVVFLAFENPEFFLDLKGVTFNSTGLREHMEEHLGHLKMKPLGVVIYNYHDMRDLYGYSQMEACLAVIGRFLKQQFPKGHIFYYRNGRFIVLTSPETDFSAKIRTITERFRHSWEAGGTELYLSVGFASFEPVHAKHSLETILNTMVKALDLAGQAGAEHVFSEADLTQTEQEKSIRKSIEDALDHNGFELYLQPIIDSASGKAIGAEALSRIRDHQGNIISPGVFIPIAENCGRIHEIGEMVFEKTCRFIKEENIEAMGIEWINVNLSPTQFVRTDLAERYSSIVEKYGIDPSKVHLEITEGSMVDDNFLLRQMHSMSEKGFKFVLDDYGTGYSNLSRLKKCPFINVKLDMSIVSDYCREPDEILPNMIQTFKHMGFCITAEGVEDASMAGLMKSIGCDCLQGYYYSKPVPEKEFKVMIASIS